MYTVSMKVKSVDGDRIVLVGDEGEFEVTRDMGDKDVLVGEKVIAAFNRGRLWFWVYWMENVQHVGGNSVMLPDHFMADIKGYRDGQCLICVGHTHYWIPAYRRVPTGRYNIKVTCRYAGSMKISRWKIES